MTVSTNDTSWMAPTGRAVFIPAGCSHAIRMWGLVEMRTLYLSPSFTQFREPACTVVEVAPLLRELVLRIIDRKGLDWRDEYDALLMNLLEAEIESAIEAAAKSRLSLPLPTDDRAAALARAVLENPSADAGVETLSRQHGVARRTLERRFRDETGMSFGMWRQKARLLDSIRLLAQGSSVTDAALDCGYSSVSAFIAAFKGTFGCTPGQM